MEPLLAHVHDPSATVRAAVVSALRPFENPRAVEAVKAALTDGDVRVEQSAAEGFSESGFGGGGGGGRRRRTGRRMRGRHGGMAAVAGWGGRGGEVAAARAGEMQSQSPSARPPPVAQVT